MADLVSLCENPSWPHLDASSTIFLLPSSAGKGYSSHRSVEKPRMMRSRIRAGEIERGTASRTRTIELISGHSALLSPLRGCGVVLGKADPRLAPWAAFFRRFAAAVRRCRACERGEQGFYALPGPRILDATESRNARRGDSGSGVLQKPKVFTLSL